MVLVGSKIKSVITHFYTSTQAALKNLISSDTLVNAMYNISKEQVAIKFKHILQFLNIFLAALMIACGSDLPDV